MHFIVADRTSCAFHAINADCAFYCVQINLISQIFGIDQICVDQTTLSDRSVYTACAVCTAFAVHTLVGVRGCTSVLSLCVKRVRAVLVDRKLRSPHSYSRKTRTVCAAHVSSAERDCARRSSFESIPSTFRTVTVCVFRRSRASHKPVVLTEVRVLTSIT